MKHIKLFEEFINEGETFTKKDIKKYFPKATHIGSIASSSLDSLKFNSVQGFRFEYPLSGNVKNGLLTLHIYDNKYFNLYEDDIVYTPNRTAAEIKSGKEVAKNLDILSTNTVKEIIKLIKRQSTTDGDELDRAMFGRRVQFYCHCLLR